MTVAQRTLRADGKGYSLGKGKGAEVPVLHAKITNGRRVFAIGGDGRNKLSIRFKRLFHAHCANYGGAENLSSPKLAILRRAASLEVILETLEVKMTDGLIENIELDLYARLAGNHRRLLEAVGLERDARDVTPATLDAYLAATDSPYADGELP